MARVNPQVEHLERMNRMLRDQIDRMRADPADIPFVACDNSCIVACDNSCIVASATGMSTNGGCRCDERKLRRAVQYWRGVAQHRQALIQELRSTQAPSKEWP